MDDKELLILLEKLQSHNITADERKRLDELLNNPAALEKLSALMEHTFEEIRSSSSNLEAYGREDIVKERLEKLIPNEPIKSKKNSNRIVYWATSLVAACALITFVFFFNTKETEASAIVWETISTAPGERKKLSLSDGTNIIVNGKTSLSYPKHTLEKLRMVRLKGEAFFDVAKNDKKPFLVIAEDFTTQVVGTSFNIDSDIGKVVEVNSGKVNVLAMKGEDAISIIGTLEQTNKEILAQLHQNSHQQASLTKGLRAKLKETLEIESYNYKNWFNNELIHLNEPLSEVAQKAYRNFGDSVLVDPQLAHKKITITFRERTQQQVLNTLAELTNGKLTRNHETETWEITKK